MNGEIISLIFCANGFQFCRYFAVIQFLTCLGVFLRQVGPHHGTGKISGNQPAYFTRLDDI